MDLEDTLGIFLEDIETAYNPHKSSLWSKLPIFRREAYATNVICFLKGI